MNASPERLYVEVRVPYTKTEQEFLRLAVQAASSKYRELQDRISSPHEPHDEACALPEDIS